MVINCWMHTKPLPHLCLPSVSNSYGWEVGMSNEQKQREELEQERARKLREEEKPQTWKHPDDGTELS
eukprot:gene20197-24002_t